MAQSINTKKILKGIKEDSKNLNKKIEDLITAAGNLDDIVVDSTYWIEEVTATADSWIEARDLSCDVVDILEKIDKGKLLKKDQKLLEKAIKKLHDFF